MHDTSRLAANGFAEMYANKSPTPLLVVEIGGAIVYGSSIRHFFSDHRYVSVDIEAANGVDIVIQPGDPLPYETGTVDILVSTSCFEHDPCFWMTFREMCRVLKPGGYIYVNAPSNGVYHKYPEDNWRFYQGAGQALAYWASREGYPVSVEECFFTLPMNDIWTDFVGVWKRGGEGVTSIVMPDDLKQKVGPLRRYLHSQGAKTETWLDGHKPKQR